MATDFVAVSGSTATRGLGIKSRTTNEQLKQPLMVKEEAAEMNQISWAPYGVNGDGSRDDINLSNLLKRKVMGAENAAVSDALDINENRRPGVIEKRAGEEKEEAPC